MALVRASVSEDIEHLAPLLREADLVELDAHGVTADYALSLGLHSSSTCLTIEHEGEAIAMFGVSPYPTIDMEKIGCVWLLGSDEITSITTQFLRESKQWLSVVGQEYELLCNVVHEGNELHHRWLKFLGFRFLGHHSPFFEFARFV